MLEKLKEFGKHSIIYGIGNMLQAAGGFLLIPFYTHMLITSDYGTLELLNRTADILILLIMFGVRHAFMRFYFDHDNDEWRKTVLGTTTVFLLCSSVVVFIVFWPIKGWVAQVIFDDPVIGVLFIYVMVWIPLDLIVDTGLIHLQIQLKSLTYVIINFFKFIAFIGSNIILLYYFEMGIVGVLVTNVWIAALIGVGFLIKIFRWTRFKVSIDVLKKMLIFGLPYIPTSFFGFIINSSDRYFLAAYSDLGEVGIYSLGFKIGMFGVMLIMEPLSNVWTPFLFDNYKKDNGAALISKLLTINALVGFAAGLGIAMAAPIVIPWISDEAYHSAYKLIPYICIGSVFFGLANLADYGILITKKTIYKPFIYGGIALIAITANFMLVPTYAGLGAAIAIAITFFALMITNFAVSMKLYPIPLEIRNMILICLGAIGVFFVADFIINIDPFNIYYQGLSLLSFLLYPVILWIGGLLNEKEKQYLFMIFKKKTS